MKQRIKRILQIVGGIVLIILGIFGIFLPFLQGIAFLFAGIILISPYHGKKLIYYTKNSWHLIKKKQYKKAFWEFIKFFKKEKKADLIKKFSETKESSSSKCVKK